MSWEEVRPPEGAVPSQGLCVLRGEGGTEDSGRCTPNWGKR